MELTPRNKLEYILLTSPGSLRRSDLASKLSDAEIEHAVEEINNDTVHTGRSIHQTATHISLVYTPETREEMGDQGDEIPVLTQALRETLACIIYGGPCDLSLIQRLRGVNSRASVQELIRRGYVNRDRDNMLSVSEEAQELLDIPSVESIPEYHTLRSKIHDNNEV